MNQINETLFSAFDTIIKQRLNSISFDNTILCTIIEKIDNLKYMVRYGEASFVAYDANNSNYQKEDQVYVIVPQGDYNQQKFILSKYVTAQTRPSGYSEPFDGFIKGSENLAKNQFQASFQVNNELTEIQLLEEAVVDNSSQGYSTIGVAADFKTYLLSTAVSGEYGVRINLYYTKEKSTYTWTEEIPVDGEFIVYTLPEGVTGEVLGEGRYRISTENLGDGEWEKLTNVKLYNLHLALFDLSSSQMYGNPYYFEGYFNQQRVFSLPEDLLTVEYISCDFYQDGNFLDKDGITDNFKGTENIFIKDLEIYFGYLKEEYEKSPVFLYSLGSKYYSEEETRDIYYRYYIEDSNKNIVLGTATSVSWLVNDVAAEGVVGEPFEATLTTGTFQTAIQAKIDEKVTSQSLIFTNLNSSAVIINDTLTVGNETTGKVTLSNYGTATLTNPAKSNSIEINADSGTITFSSGTIKTVITLLDGDIAVGTGKINEANKGIMAQLKSIKAHLNLS